MDKVNFEKFREVVSKVIDDFDDIKAEFLFARTDEVRQQIIDGINDGSINNEDDINEITIQQSPVWKYEHGIKQGDSEEG